MLTLSETTAATWACTSHLLPSCTFHCWAKVGCKRPDSTLWQNPLKLLATLFSVSVTCHELFLIMRSQVSGSPTLRNSGRSLYTSPVQAKRPLQRGAFGPVAWRISTVAEDLEGGEGLVL